MCLSIHLFEIVHYKLLNSTNSSINISINDKMETIQLISWIQVLSYTILWNKKTIRETGVSKPFSIILQICVCVYICVYIYVYIYKIHKNFYEIVGGYVGTIQYLRSRVVCLLIFVWYGCKNFPLVFWFVFS